MQPPELEPRRLHYCIRGPVLVSLPPGWTWPQERGQQSRFAVVLVGFVVHDGVGLVLAAVESEWTRCGSADCGPGRLPGSQDEYRTKRIAGRVLRALAFHWVVEQRVAGSLAPYSIDWTSLAWSWIGLVRLVWRRAAGCRPSSSKSCPATPVDARALRLPQRKAVASTDWRASNDLTPVPANR